MGAKTEARETDNQEMLKRENTTALAVRARMQSVSKKVISANRSATLLSLAATAILLFISTCSTVAVIFTRPTHVTSTQLRDANENVVQTGVALDYASLTALPLSGDFDQYDRIVRVRLPLNDGIMSKTVVGYTWHNDTTMELDLYGGATISITGVDEPVVLITAAGEAAPSSRRKLTLTCGDKCATHCMTGNMGRCMGYTSSSDGSCREELFACEFDEISGGSSGGNVVIGGDGGTSGTKTKKKRRAAYTAAVSL